MHLSEWPALQSRFDGVHDFLAGFWWATAWVHFSLGGRLNRHESPALEFQREFLSLRVSRQNRQRPLRCRTVVFLGEFQHADGLAVSAPGFAAGYLVSLGGVILAALCLRSADAANQSEVEVRRSLLKLTHERRHCGFLVGIIDQHVQPFNENDLRNRIHLFDFIDDILDGICTECQRERSSGNIRRKQIQPYHRARERILTAIVRQNVKCTLECLMFEHGIALLLFVEHVENPGRFPRTAGPTNKADIAERKPSISLTIERGNNIILGGIGPRGYGIQSVKRRRQACRYARLRGRRSRCADDNLDGLSICPAGRAPRTRKTFPFGLDCFSSNEPTHTTSHGRHWNHRPRTQMCLPATTL